MRWWTLGAALSLGLLGAVGAPRGARAEEPERPLLLRLADPADPDHEQARASWESLSEAAQDALVRAGLSSEDPALARAAAVLARPFSLDLPGLHRLDRVLERDPLARLLPADGLDGLADAPQAFGSAGLPALWRALGERDPDPLEVGYAGLHRVLTHAEVAPLAPLLASLKPRPFRALLWDLVNQAQGTLGETNQEVFLAAFGYALARLDAEAAGQPPPAWGRPVPPPTRAGLPAVFRDLARACWGPAGAGFDRARPDWETEEARGSVSSGPLPSGPFHWLCALARRLTPGEADVPFLMETVQAARAPPEIRWWAGRHLARGSGREGGRALREVLSLGDESAWMAAAEEASQGRREDWDRFARAAPSPEPVQQGPWRMALWLADPAAATQDALRRLSAGGRLEDLTEEARWGYAFDAGVEVSGAALDALTRRVRAGGLPPALDLWFFAHVRPEAFGLADAQRLAEAFRASVPPENLFKDGLAADLWLLEVRAPQALVTLLSHWVEHAQPRARDEALELLARLGDASHLSALLERWGAFREPWLLGRVRTPQVRAFLRERAGSADLGIEANALQALAVLEGCPEPLAKYFSDDLRDRDEPLAEGWAEAKALVLAGDPIGGALARTAAGPNAGLAGLEVAAGFGLVRDPRVVERLKVWAGPEVSGLLWPVTAMQALAGDQPSRAAWRAFLGEARTFLLDDLQDPLLFALDGDPELVADWAARLDQNCCLAWHADQVLHAVFPTLPFFHLPGDAGRARAATQAWLERHRATFVRSRLLDGWVPGPPAR